MGKPIGVAQVGRPTCKTCKGTGVGSSGKDCKRCDRAYRRAMHDLCNRLERVARDFNASASDVNQDLGLAYLNGVDPS